MARSTMIASRAVAAGAMALAALSGCSDHPTAPQREPASMQLVVSEPVTPPPASAALARAVPAAAGVAYISLSPGSVPGATSAGVRNRATGASLTVAVVGGGFDPVAIAARVDDELAIEIRDASGVIASLKAKVPPKRAPAVVRTSPPKGKTDVPLNSRVTVVFSEPVDPASVTAATVRLSANGQPVAGTVQVEPSGLAADFVPQTDLAPSTEYELTVTSAVRDLSGDPLEAPATTQFTTGTTSTGSLRVTTATSGQDPDPDGYTVEIGASSGSFTARQPIGVNASVTSAAIPEGTYTVFLTGVASHCTVAGSRSFAVTVPLGSTVDVAFTIQCGTSGSGLVPELAFVRDGQIYLINSDGTGLVQLTNSGVNMSPAWSPDGRRIAFMSARGGGWDIYVMGADGSNVVRRTTSGYNETPSWSPDGARIAFAAVGAGSLNVYAMSADDDGTSPVLVVDRPGWDGQPAWSPDGTGIAFVSDWQAYDFVYDVYVTTPDGTRITQLTSGFGQPGALYFQPAWSPDGRTLAVVSCRPDPIGCGESALMVMNADGSGLRTLTSGPGFAKPTWSPDGQTIAFSSVGSVKWIRTDGSAQGVIAAYGYNPSWRR